MPLRSTVSSLAKAAEPGEMPTAPAPRLGRRPGMYTPPANRVDILSGDDADQAEDSTTVVTEPIEPSSPPQVSKFKATRKPRTPKAAPAAPVVASTDVKATRALLGQVEGDMLDLKAQMQKALAKFQPKLERLQARHAELSASLVKQLTQ